MKIKLQKFVWELVEDEKLGPPGGFGQVYRGQRDDENVAIKRLNLTASAAAHRELSIGKALASRTLDHVVPVLDYGQDAEDDRYYLVMPICECSLQDVLDERGKLPWEEAQAVTLNIIAGLMEVDGLVHRDLKPANVLRHEGRWKIADFGIAKFVEDSTSLQTLRHALTPAYAAPEQWLGEPPTKATDIYALGCLQYATLNGHPPFRGDLDAMRLAHLNGTPPSLLGVDPRISGIVQHMMRKSPESRPSLTRCETVFRASGSYSSKPANQALAEVGAQIAQREAEAEATNRAEERLRQQRKNLADEAAKLLSEIMERLFAEIAANAASAKRAIFAVTLGSGRLSYTAPATDVVVSNQYRHGWDVAASSTIKLRCDFLSRNYRNEQSYSFEANLVYARSPNDEEFRWREMSFWSFNAATSESPFALSPGSREFDVALSNVTSGISIAHGPFSIDAEDEEAFQHRWLNLFAKAAAGNLFPPSELPLREKFFA